MNVQLILAGMFPGQLEQEADAPNWVGKGKGEKRPGWEKQVGFFRKEMDFQNNRDRKACDNVVSTGLSGLSCLL